MAGIDFLQSKGYKAQDQAVGSCSVKYLSPRVEGRKLS